MIMMTTRTLTVGRGTASGRMSVHSCQCTATGSPGPVTRTRSEPSDTVTVTPVAWRPDSKANPKCPSQPNSKREKKNRSGQTALARRAVSCWWGHYRRLGILRHLNRSNAVDSAFDDSEHSRRGTPICLNINSR